ncbi:MAG: hypothetical protein R2940_17020 [Syntrophotaleaceae bacterium]
MSTDRLLSQREISHFFFPLLLNVQLMSLSHSVINAALARGEKPVLALAGFSIAMVLHLFLASPSYQNHTITIALVRNRRSLLGVGGYVLAVAIYVSLLLTLIGYSPLGPWVLQELLGTSPEIAAEARKVIAVLAFLPFLTGIRGLCQGLVIRARHTGLVSLATLVRIGALLGFLFLGRSWFSGATLGAFGLLGCIAVETCFMVWFAWKTWLPEEDVSPKKWRDIFHYSLPLSFSSAMQQAVPLLIGAIISRLPDAALALAAYGIIRGFIFLLAGPMRNLQQAYLTLVKSRHDDLQLVIFFRRVAIGMALIMLLAAYPLNLPIMQGIMGLSDELRRYIALPLAACLLYPVFYGAVNLLRGHYAAAHRTGQLGWATVFKVGYLMGCWMVIRLTGISPPGIALAVFLLLTCEVCEAWYLRRGLHWV